MQKTKNKLYSILMLSLILPVFMFFCGCGEKTAHIHFKAEEGQTVVYTSIADVTGYHIFVFEQGAVVPNFDDYKKQSDYYVDCEKNAFLFVYFTHNYGEHTKDGIKGIDCLASGEYYMQVEVKIESNGYAIDKSIYLNGEKLTPDATGIVKKGERFELFYSEFGLNLNETNMIEYKV
ncbi:MAG: hypothetical protein IJ837_03050 [Clostridia bacterium]|nr:hypothetical protein [Clostridia bacterium]